MRCQSSFVVLWCGVFVSNLTACITPSFAASQPETPDATHAASLQATPETPLLVQTDSLTLDQNRLTLDQSRAENPVTVPEDVTLSQGVTLSQAPPAPAPGLPEPNENRLLQPVPVPQPVTPGEQTPVIPTPAPPAPVTPSEAPVRVLVQRIEVTGSTVFGSNDFAPIIQSAEGQSLTLEELRTIADRITQLYLDQGYITSRAVLVEQVVSEGVIQIRVVEGALERIEVEGNHRVNTSYIRDRIQLGASTPLNQANLEDQLRLLRLDPLFENITANLRAGSGLGQSILIVQVTEADPLVANFSSDNYSPPSVGSERFGVSASYLSLTGLGDTLSATYARSTTGGSDLFDFSYRVPLNPMNGTLELRAAPSSYRITDPKFSALNIEGNSDLYELSFRQPLLRSPREEFALSLGFTYRDGETFINNFSVDNSTTSVFKFGQDYVLRDVQGAWALQSQFNLGTGLFDATQNSGSQADGQFFSWLGQAQRVQILNPNNLLIVQADLQLSPDPLLSSQQFVIGGGQSVRGYRQNSRIGDNGFRFSAEDRISILRDEAGTPTLQFAPFADVGVVWNVDGNSNNLPRQTFLPGIGVGLLWEPFPRFNVRLDFAVPLVNLDDRGVNAQDDGFYFSVNYRP
jgi:hemolysin activation/secretion protein